MRLRAAQLLWGACAIVLVAQAPPSRSWTHDSPQSHIAVGEDYFRPVEVSLAVGTVVTWVNQGARPHTVKSFEGNFASDRMAPGDEFTVTFWEPGSYGYLCDYHAWMSGTIIVTARE